VSLLPKLNPNLEGVLAKDPSLVALLEEKAKQVADTAQSIAPTGSDDDPHPGRFRDSIHAEGNKVVSDDPAALYIEMGTIDTPPHLTLHIAAETEGLKVKGR
jgi:ABC-type Fe3+-hydroxamate transport system substrate-binding protein